MNRGQDRWLAWALIAAGLVALLSACRSTPAVRLYVLESRAVGLADREASPWPAAAVVGVGPVELPEYLNRPQIVSRLSANRLRTEDTARWAEPLTANVQRVLVEDLAVTLASDRLLSYPWKKAETPTYQLKVEILRLDAGPEAAVRLEARWSIVDRQGKVVAGPQRTDIEQATSLDYEAVAQAESQALAELSRAIACELRRLAARP